MSSKQIFISCGQCTEKEKSIGEIVKSAIDETDGFYGYFADKIQDFDSLCANTLEAIQQSSGAIIVLHGRGMVEFPSGQKWGPRSSVWINQEIAILAYRQFFEESHLPVLAFKDSDVKIEGAMSSLIINPRLIPSEGKLEQEIKNWLAEETFSVTSRDVFLEKWELLDEHARYVIASLVDNGGTEVNVSTIKKRLKEHYGVKDQLVSQSIISTKLVFQTTSLVQIKHNPPTDDVMSLHPSWKWDLRRAIAAWLKHR